MLKRLAVKNFRLLRDVTIDVEPGKPIVLIGPNSSGKSSVLQVLDLLGRWADEGLEKGLLAYGGINAVSTRLQNTNSLTIEASVDAEDWIFGKGSFRYGISLTSYGHVADEWLQQTERSSPSEPLVSRTRDRDTVRFWNSNTETIDEQKGPSIHNRLSFELVKQTSFYDFLELLRAELSSIELYDGFLTTPLWARDVREGQLSPHDSAVLAPMHRIDRRGLNLVNALYHLQNNHATEWDELVDAFRAEFPFVLRLEFPADPAGGRIALGWRDRRHAGVRMLGHQMSEGMTSYLCLLAAILSPAHAAALAFDEPDAHLHPSAMRRIVHLLERASQRTAIFIATHSDRFLDYLSDPAGSLRICEPSESGVTIRSLDRDTLDAWRKDYTVSELRGRGHLDPPNEDGVDR